MAFETQPVVSVEDAGGNVVTSDSDAVTLSITTPAGANLACTTNPVDAEEGVATFAGCSIDLAGTYTLTATDGSMNQQSSSLTIDVGSAAQLAFTTQPSDSTGGVAFETQPVVTVQDAGGNTVTGDTSSVTLALTVPAGANLTCTTNPNAADAGVSTFAGCAVDQAGTYTLTASDDSLTTAHSSSFAIAVGQPVALVFERQPVGSLINTDFPTQPIVRVVDAGGNQVTSDTSAVTLTLTSGPDGAILSCTANPKNAVGGDANFAGCQIDTAGDYTITASDGSLTPVDSAPVTVLDEA